MNILDYFKDLSKVPRPSGYMDKVSEYCVNFAKERNLWVYKDEFQNVIIKKPATKGMENAPTVIIQAHMDMVAEKTKDSNHNFNVDGIEIMEDDKYIYAKDTTLGADDGIGVSYGLALMDGYAGINGGELVHPAIELVLTTDEETGLTGAEGIDTSILEGKKIINIDYDVEGSVIIGSAGGGSVHFSIPVEFENAGNDLSNYEITVLGLKGGHSGAEIDKERGNADILLARVLKEIDNATYFSLVSIEGGNKDNAIPRTATAKIATNSSIDLLKETIVDIDKTLKNELQFQDPDVCISITPVDKSQVVMTKDSKDKIILFLNTVPNGVVSMSMALKGVVETSLNLGILKTTDTCVCGHISTRSMLGSRKKALQDKVISLVNYLGGSATVAGVYPAWEYNDKSELLNTCKQVYENMYGTKLNAFAIHAGLECGYFADKIEGAEIISMGPDTLDIHTTEERADKASIIRVYEYLLEILKNIK